MQKICIAIGDNYELEAQRLDAKISGLNIIKLSSSNYDALDNYKDLAEFNDNYIQLLRGLFTKTNFGHYVEEIDGKVVLMDADLMAVRDDADQLLKDIDIDDADLALVPYRGTWHYPDTYRQEIYDAVGHNINSGFIVFKNASIAKEISIKWRDNYLNKIDYYCNHTNSIWEYDEPALLEVLALNNYKLKFIDRKWNAWEQDHLSDNQIFAQLHENSTHLNLGEYD